MLTVFYKTMKQYNHATWEILTVCGCQALLIAFNVVLLWLTAGNWKQRAGTKSLKMSPSPVSSPGTVAVRKGEKQGVSSGSTVHVMATRSQQRIAPSLNGETLQYCFAEK